MTENFPKLISDIKPLIQEAQRTNTKQDKCKKKRLHLDISFSNCRKSKIKKKF